MRFFYDSTGKRVGFANGTMLFYYLYNVQGDVIAIVRAATGQVVAKYSYDAWGNCTVTNATGYAVGDKNPFRYRGYYYDTETGLYYLNSRYYRPEFGRFISADSLIDNRGASTQNLFAYCGNNPIVRVDCSGQYWMLIGAVVGALVSGAVSAVSQYITIGSINWKTVGINAAAGAISGALATTAIGFGASVGANAGLGGAAYISDQTVNGNEITLDGLAINTFAGAVGGAIGGSGANAKGLTTTWENATNGISRELRRANTKYAAKRIAEYSAGKKAVKIAVKVATCRIGFGTIGSAITICKLQIHEWR